MNMNGKVTRRAVLAAALVAASGVGAAGQPAPYDTLLQARYELAKKEGKVTLYTVESADLVQQLGDAFKKRFPGIDFDFFRGDTTTMNQRFEAEVASGRHSADAIMGTEDRSEIMADKGWFARHESPVATVYPRGSQPTNGLWYRHGISTTAFAWNTNLVKPEDAPKSWNDLLDPKWKGKIGMQDPKSGGGGAHAWTARMHRVLGEEKWHQFMDQLGKQIGRYGAYFPVREALASGEIAIQVAAYPDFTEPLKLKGAPVDWGTPDPTFFVALTMQVSKFAPHVNAGRLFVDFMLTEEAQKILGDAGKIPALPGLRPGGCSKLNTAKLEPMDPNNLWGTHPKTWFDEQIRTYFAPGR